MKYFIMIGFSSLGLVLATSQVRADTCTAPGHPSCTISCPAGCIAMYYEPNGPCRTMCSGSMKIEGTGPAASVDAKGVNAPEIEHLLKTDK